MHAIVFVIINPHIKFEMPSFTHPTDVTGAPKSKNGSRDSGHSH